LKLDENITVGAAAPLLALGHDVDTVGDEGLAGHADPEVLAGAVTARRALVTFDLGFGEPRAYPSGSPLRGDSASTPRSAARQRRGGPPAPREHHDLDRLSGCIVVVTERSGEDPVAGLTSLQTRAAT